MKYILHILPKYLIVLVLGFLPFLVKGQFEDCNFIIPPCSISGIEVTHTLGQNVIIWDDDHEWYFCGDSTLIIPAEIPFIVLGEMVVFDPVIWNPFKYTLFFSKPIYSMEFILYVGNGENCIFETSESSISLQTISSCDEITVADTIFLGFNTGSGDGIFSINFSCPIYSFSISGNGEGAGVGFQICSTSLVTPNLWGKVSGDSILTSTQDSVFFTAFGDMAPFTFSYTVNGGAVQTLVSNTPQAWLPAPSSNGNHTYELLQVKDGNDSIAVIACNSAYVAVVNLASTAELELLNFSLSPNPAKEELYISESVYFEENAAVQLTDMEGRTVLVTKYQQGEALDISALKSGLYFLRIESEKGWVAKRFVKY